MKKTLLFTLLLAVLLFGFDTKAYNGLLLGSYSNDTQEQLYAKNTKKNRKANKSKATNKGGFVGTWQLVDKDKKGYERYLVITKENGSYYGKLSCYDLGHNSKKVMAESFRSGLSFTFDEKFYPNNYVTVFLRGNKLIEGETTYDIFGNATEWTEKTWRRVSDLPKYSDKFIYPDGTWIARINDSSLTLEITFDETRHTYDAVCYDMLVKTYNIENKEDSREVFTTDSEKETFIYGYKFSGSFSLFKYIGLRNITLKIDPNSIKLVLIPHDMDAKTHSMIGEEINNIIIPFLSEISGNYIFDESSSKYEFGKYYKTFYKSGLGLFFENTNSKLKLP